MSANLDKEPYYNVVQSNDLIEASYKLTRNEMRLLVLALSKINSKEENPGRIELYPKEFIEMFETSEKNVWVTMRNALIKLMKKQVEFFRLDNEAKKTVNMVNWLDGGTYYSNQKDNSKILLRFSRGIEPYLFELKGNFTICSIKAIQKLTNSVALRIYWMLLNNINKEKGLAKKRARKVDVFTYKISMARFRATFPEISSKFEDIKKFTLKPALEQIQSLTDISLTWKTVKTGKKVTDIEITYVLEGSDFIHEKPIRPRLCKRPHVKSGSHAEGEWMQKNAEILYQYENDLKDYDQNLRLNIQDLRRAVECSRLFKPAWYNEKLEELATREGKEKKVKKVKKSIGLDEKLNAKDNSIEKKDCQLQTVSNGSELKQINGRFFDKKSAEAAGYKWDGL